MSKRIVYRAKITSTVQEAVGRVLQRAGVGYSPSIATPGIRRELSNTKVRSYVNYYPFIVNQPLRFSTWFEVDEIIDCDKAKTLRVYEDAVEYSKLT